MQSHWDFFTTCTFLPVLRTLSKINQSDDSLSKYTNKVARTEFLKLQLHDAVYRLRFYLNSLIHVLSLSNSHNNVASIQKNRGDKLHDVIAALIFFSTTKLSTICNPLQVKQPFIPACMRTTHSSANSACYVANNCTAVCEICRNLKANFLSSQKPLAAS